MNSMNISLPDNLRSYVDSVIESDGYGTSSEYIRELIREDQKRRAAQKLDQLLLEGLESGGAIAMDDAYWKRKRKTLTGSE